MTREEQIAKLTELRASVDEKVKAYNEAMQEGKLDEASKLDTDMAEDINQYTGIVRDMCFEDCAATENPMLAAVTLLSYQTIAVKDDKKDKTIPVREVIEKEKQIDLLKLHKFVSGGIGHDKQWPYAIEKFNMLLTAQKAVDLGIDPKEVNDSYKMQDISREYDLGKNPASKTNLLKTMTVIVQEMLGEGYKPVSHDVNYLMSIYSKKNRKALTVTCANHRYLTAYIMEICHRIVTGKSYEVDYKKKEN